MVPNVLLYITVIILNVYAVYGLPQVSSSNETTKEFQLITRDEWDAVPPNNTNKFTTPVEYVVIHHTALPAACYTTDKCKKAMKSMQNYHNSLNFGDIGYNFCVGSEGSVYEGRGWKAMGVHAGRANNFSVGICLIGDWRVELPPAIQLATTKALIAQGVEQEFLSSDYKLLCHNQVRPTECPGKALSDEVSTWDHYMPGAVKF